MSTIKTIQIDLPSDILLALGNNQESVKSDIKKSYAVYLYVQGQVTIGKAVQTTDSTRLEFEKVLSRLKIPISTLTEEDVLRDIDKQLKP